VFRRFFFCTDFYFSKSSSSEDDEAERNVSHRQWTNRFAIIIPRGTGKRMQGGRNQLKLNSIRIPNAFL